VGSSARTSASPKPLFKELIKAKVSQVSRRALADLEGALQRRRCRQSPGNRRSPARGQQAADRRSLAGRLPRAAITEVDIFFPERDDQSALVLSPHAPTRDSIRFFQGSADSKSIASCAPAIPRPLETATQSLPRMFLRPAQVRFQPRRPPEVQHQDGARYPGSTIAPGTPPTSFRPSSISSSCAKNIGVVDDHRPSSANRPRSRGRLNFSKTSFASAWSRMERAHQGKRWSVYQEMVHGPWPPRPGSNAKPGHGGHPRILRKLAVEPVHGPDQPAQRNHHKASVLSALGPGGLSRGSAQVSKWRGRSPGTHYGRICPIENRRKGPNIGLDQLAQLLLPRINDYGFIESALPPREGWTHQLTTSTSVPTPATANSKAGGHRSNADRVEELKRTSSKRRKGRLRTPIAFLSLRMGSRTSTSVAQAKRFPLDERLKNHHGNSSTAAKPETSC